MCGQHETIQGRPGSQLLNVRLSVGGILFQGRPIRIGGNPNDLKCCST
jgi:hypothetical protein